MRNFRAKQFAIACANHSGEDQIGRLVLPGAQSCDHANPAPDFPLPQNRESMFDRMNLRGKTECRRIEIAQQPIAEGGFAFYDEINFREFEVVVRNGLQQPQVVDAVLGNLTSVQKFGLAKKITLKI